MFSRYFLFFFFKQKTAYEMRISDWSSDVCSSDLIIFSFLRSIGRDGLDRLTQRMLSELTTTFASHYTRVIGLREALQPDILQAYQRKATGEKYLIDPTRS